MPSHEISYDERAFPSLLDRLIGIPLQTSSARHQAFLADLEWLLNARADRYTRDDGSNQLDSHPEVARSVVNFGVPDLAGRSMSSLDLRALEERMLKAIHDFEPRLVPGKVKVRTVAMSDSVGFSIEGELRTLAHVPERFLVLVNVDLETGACTFQER